MGQLSLLMKGLFLPKVFQQAKSRTGLQIQIYSFIYVDVSKAAWLEAESTTTANVLPDTNDK